MGLFDNLFGGGDATSTQSPDGNVVNAMGGALGQLQNLYAPLFQQGAPNLVQPLSLRSQLTGGDLEDLASQVGPQRYSQDFMNLGQQGQQALMSRAGSGYSAVPFAGTTFLSPMTSQRALTTGETIAARSNPYLDQVLERARDGMNRDRAGTHHNISLDAARTGAFGGSGEAIRRAAADDNFNNRMADMDAQMRHQAFEVGRDQSNRDANTINSALDMNTMLAGANADRLTAGAGRTADAMFAASRQELDAINRAFGLGMQGVQGGSSAEQTRTNNMLNIYDAMLRFEEMQRGINQAQRNQPYERIGEYINLLGATQNGLPVTTSQPRSGSGFGSFITGLGGLAGMLF